METTPVTTENVPVSDVSEEQVDKFFESGGEVELEQKQAKPEPKVEEKPEAKVEKEEPKEKFVPHGALHEERMKRKQLQSEIEKLRAKSERMEQIFQQHFQQQNGQTQKQVPAFEENPAEHLRAQQEDLRRQQEQMHQFLANQHQQTQQNQRVQQLVGKYHAAADEFKQKQPDFGEAYSYVINSRIREYESLGYSKQEASMFVQQEEISIVEKSIADEVSPAERVYMLAKARGYAPKKEQKQETSIENIEKGVKNAKSLGAISGKSSDQISLEQLADLEGEEFDKAWDKLIGSK